MDGKDMPSTPQEQQEAERERAKNMHKVDTSGPQDAPVQDDDELHPKGPQFAFALPGEKISSGDPGGGDGNKPTSDSTSTDTTKTNSDAKQDPKTVIGLTPENPVQMKEVVIKGERVNKNDGAERANEALRIQANDTRTYKKERGPGYKTDPYVDCSEFTSQVNSAVGYNYGPNATNAQGQYNELKSAGQLVNGFENIQTGDQIFFHNGTKVDHTGIVVKVNKDGSVWVAHATVNKGRKSLMLNQTDRQGNIKGFSKFFGIGRPKRK